MAVVTVVNFQKKGANGSRFQDCEKTVWRIMIHRLHHLHYPCLLLLLAAPFVSSCDCNNENGRCCPGHYSAGFWAPVKCPLCASGLYQPGCPNSMSVHCKTCPAGFYVKSDMTDCLYCSGGQYNSQDGQQPAACVNCPSGQHAKTVTGPCATCDLDPDGTTPRPFVYTAETSGIPPTYHCSACELGYAMKTGESECSICSVGQYQDVTSSPTWGAGYNTFNCKMCQPGKYGMTSGAQSSSDCQSCLTGYYSKENGATSIASCKTCPDGWTNTIRGSTNCTKASVDPGCAQGKYSTEAGTIKSSQCVDCPTGTFSAKSDQVHSCAGTCSAGKFSSKTGIISDSQCKGQCSAGRWSSETGRSSDDQCDGRCSSGKYSAAIGLSSDE